MFKELELWRAILWGAAGGTGFAFARGFVQALVDDWRSWRGGYKEVAVNDEYLSNDDEFLLELDAAIRRSYDRSNR